MAEEGLHFQSQILKQVWLMASACDLIKRNLGFGNGPLCYWELDAVIRSVQW